MRLNIQTQPAILAWKTHNVKQTTPSMPKDPLKLEIKKPQLKMESRDAVVKIDQTQCFNESGLKTNKAFLDERVQLSKEAVSDGIANRVEEGNAMMAIENRQDAVAERAYYNANERFVHEFGLKLMPQSRPEITVELGDVTYEFERGEVKVLNQIPKIDKGSFEPGKVEFYMKQMSSITITPVGDNINLKI